MRDLLSGLGLLGILTLAGLPAPAGAQPVGSEFQVNTYTTNIQFTGYGRSVAADASGNFVVVWDSLSQDGSGRGVFGQRYDSAGTALGAEFRVNSYTTGYQSSTFVASDASGNVVVVWLSDQLGQLGDYDIFGQRYDSTGATMGSEFQVNSSTEGSQKESSVASDASGNFVVVWAGYSDDGQFGAFGQRYDSAGVAQGDEFQINSYTTGAGRSPYAAATGTNQFVAAWSSYGQDGSSWGVFGQRFDFSGSQTITVVKPNTDVKWRIGSVKEIQWTHNLGLNATFRIELDRDDDGTYEELIAAAAPASSATKGSFAWTITGPPTPTARIRVSWTDDPSVSDASDTTFHIKPAD